LKSGIVILAAGSSRRMGRPKLLLPWGTTSVLGHQISLWEAFGAAQICIVYAEDDPGMRAELDRLAVPIADRIVNPHTDQDMFGSICCAAMWKGWYPDLTHVVISLGDQPHLRLETLLALGDLAKEQPDRICQPCRNGHMRHPVILPKQLFRELQITRAATLKEFLGSHLIASIEIDDPGLDLDIDEPADYEQALRLSRRAT
jgi:molybdenum cofactor cytidylyltransferase